MLEDASEVCTQQNAFTQQLSSIAEMTSAAVNNALQPCLDRSVFKHLMQVTRMLGVLQKAGSGYEMTETPSARFGGCAASVGKQVSPTASRTPSNKDPASYTASAQRAACVARVAAERNSARLGGWLAPRLSRSRSDRTMAGCRLLSRAYARSARHRPQGPRAPLSSPT